MHISQFAGKIRCAHCSQLCSTKLWPINGDRTPFYFQREPGKYQVTVDCPHCTKTWYVAWDDDPGPIQPLFGAVAAPTTSHSPPAVPFENARPPQPSRTHQEQLVQQKSLSHRLGQWFFGHLFSSKVASSVPSPPRSVPPPPSSPKPAPPPTAQQATLRQAISPGMQEGIFGDGTFRAVNETPDWKIGVGTRVRYCGGRRAVGEWGQVLEAYSDGACVVKWDSDGAVCLHGDHLLSKN